MWDNQAVVLEIILAIVVAVIVLPVFLFVGAEVGNSLPTLRTVDGRARLADLPTRGALVCRRDARHRAPPVGEHHE